MPAITATMAYPECEADAELDDTADCPECEDAGEVFVEHGPAGGRLYACPLWCAAAHHLYDDRGDHDRGKE